MARSSTFSLAVLVVGVLRVNAASAAQRSSAGPLDKALSLLKDVRTKVNEEGTAEAKTYETFACFCKDTMASKAAAISTGSSEKATLHARLNSAASERDAADVSLVAAVAAIGAAEAEIERLTAERHAERLKYEENEVDLTGAVQAITSAIHELKAAKLATTSFAALRSLGHSEAVRRALMMVEVLSPGQARHASATLAALKRAASGRGAQAATPSSVYEFHADDIITTLEDLKTSFKGQKTTLDQDEVKARQAYELAVQDQRQIVATKTTAVADHKRTKAEQTSLIAADTQDLTTVSARLLDDQAYLADLSDKCHNKAVLWDQRSQLRANELQVLSEAITIMEELNEASGPSFLQLAAGAAAPHHHLRLLRRRGGGKLAVRSSLSRRASAAAAFLRKRGGELRSADLLRLASQASEDPFAKVKQLIQDLIERLLKEAQQEANHKGWCDGQMAAAEQVRDTNAKTVEEVNERLAVNVARQEKLHEAVQTLTAEVAALNATLVKTQDMRAMEKAQSVAAVAEAVKARDAVNDAIRILREFYGTAKNAKVSLVQLSARRSARGSAPEDDLPDPGFDSVYMGAQGLGSGVLAMLEVVASDFERTISETNEQEAAADKALLELQTESGASIASKVKAKDLHASSLLQAGAEEGSDRQEVATAEGRVTSAKAELESLHKACLGGGMSAEERKLKREEEIEALKAALTILDGQ